MNNNNVDEDDDDDQIESVGNITVNNNPPAAHPGNKQAASDRGGQKRRKTKKTGVGAGRGQGFTEAEQYTMLELIGEIKPIGPDRWDTVTDRFNRVHPNPG